MEMSGDCSFATDSAALRVKARITSTARREQESATGRHHAWAVTLVRDVIVG